jgi:hypothetical protein
LTTFFYYCTNYAEVNRNKVLEAGAFETINDVLRNSTHPDAIKTACGALLNTTMACGKRTAPIWSFRMFT